MSNNSNSLSGVNNNHAIIHIIAHEIDGITIQLERQLLSLQVTQNTLFDIRQ